MPALYWMLSGIYYAQNYASIIGWCPSIISDAAAVGTGWYS